LKDSTESTFSPASVLQNSAHFSFQIELHSPVSQNGVRTATGDVCVCVCELC